MAYSRCSAVYHSTVKYTTVLYTTLQDHHRYSLFVIMILITIHSLSYTLPYYTVVDPTRVAINTARLSSFAVAPYSSIVQYKCLLYTYCIAT